MSKRKGFLWSGLTLLLAAALAFKAPSTSTWSHGAEKMHAPDNSSGATIAQLEKRAFSLVNDYRRGKGLPVLRVNKEAEAQARQHSRDMADGTVAFGHDGANDRLKAVGKTLRRLEGGGENVFECSQEYNDPAAEAVNDWLKSEGHRENIEGDYNQSGMGIARASNGDLYFTQIFVKGK